MPLHWFNRLGLSAAILMLPALTLTERWQPPATAQESSLSGQLLIAAADMFDPRFARTVILMVRHDRNGAFGIIVNRPVGERPWSALLHAIGDSATTVEGNVRIFYGGPVQLDAGFVIHSPDYHRAETIDIGGMFAMTSNRDVIRDIATKQGPAKSLIAFGYAGWAPGQLEGEIARRAWSTAPADTKTVFDEDRDKVWDD